MTSPQKGFPSSPRARMTAPGLFKDGLWCCDCPDRPAAKQHQVKKHSPNHGRYFWTCDQPQHLRCKFFLWASDAEIREQATVLSNSRSEVDPPSLTPSKPKTPGRLSNGLMTPQTERRFIDNPSRSFISPPKTAKARMISEASDEYGWNDDSDENEELTNVLSSSQATEPFVSQPDFHRESPSKVPRTQSFTSPGKRKFSEALNTSSPQTQSALATPFSSRSSRTEQFPPSSAELCMTPTPSKYSDVLYTDSKYDMTDLSKSLLDVLDKHSVVLPSHAQREMVALLNQHDLRTKGISKGRDMARMLLKKRDDEIVKLKERISNLEAQKELDRSLIEGMKLS
ncbi:hypothetical protein PENARI_c006G11411 [Penicillium arizonense]|uniref:GRF-type domain-containing protein n=1 Tax=Penicillium arizonense TaxID=1835702 RepID=A0A1F5LNV9_PENAI|nr:hypothetical protein PENARI_c006G11411 [Penicillium arizonense]OGE54609.1 hypothetical protein PENARI_c006G11411 [Penicillium arizonense]